MQTNRYWSFVVLVCIIVAGCATAVRKMPADMDERDRELSHGYSLLYSVVSKQVNMPTLFLLKRPSSTTRELINEIASASQEARDTLRKFAQDSPGIVLTDSGLPLLEDAVREAAETSSRDQILFGEAFELRLLISQVESSSYIAHLAEQIARRDDDTTRTEQLQAIADRFNTFNERVVAHIATLSSSD